MKCYEVIVYNYVISIIFNCKTPNGGNQALATKMENGMHRLWLIRQPTNEAYCFFTSHVQLLRNGQQKHFQKKSSKHIWQGRILWFSFSIIKHKNCIAPLRVNTYVPTTLAIKTRRMTGIRNLTGYVSNHLIGHI